MSSVDTSKDERVKQRKLEHDRMVAALLKDHYANETALKNGVAQNGGNSEPSSANADDAANVDRDLGVVNNDARQRKLQHDQMVAALLKDHYAEETARKNGIAENGGNSESSSANVADAAGVNYDAGVVGNVARQRQLRHDRMVAELLSDYDSEHGASDKLFIERTVAGYNNDAKPSLANVADVNPYVHPYVWQCVDDGDHQGCGAVLKAADPLKVQQHRQSKLHARGIALGASDLSKGIRADGWHCVDDGDNLGCGCR
jgi:hypothetical protein